MKTNETYKESISAQQREKNNNNDDVWALLNYSKVRLATGTTPKAEEAKALGFMKERKRSGAKSPKSGNDGTNADMDVDTDVDADADVKECDHANGATSRRDDRGIVKETNDRSGIVPEKNEEEQVKQDQQHGKEIIPKNYNDGFLNKGEGSKDEGDVMDSEISYSSYSQSSDKSCFSNEENDDELHLFNKLGDDDGKENEYNENFTFNLTFSFVVDLLWLCQQSRVIKHC
jgi:hypothetical protein